MAHNDRHVQWSPYTKLLISAAIFSLMVYFMVRFRMVIPPLIVAMILAYVLSPGVKRIQSRLKIGRGLATALTYLLLLAVASLGPVLIIPVLVDQLGRLSLNFQNIILTIEELLVRRIELGGLIIDVRELANQTIALLQNILEPAFGQTLGIAFGVISSAAWGVFILVISFYLVKDGERLIGWLESLAPPGYGEDVRRLKLEINNVWGAFFRGQLILALVVALIFTVISFAVGIPFALAMGVLAGLLEFIPSVGHAIWLFIASLLTFFQGSTWLPLPNWIVMLIVIGLHLIFQQVDINFLIPRIIGRRVHLHPLVVILGIVIGAIFAGVLGVVLAAPTISSARIVGRYVYHRLIDSDPFPESEQPSVEISYEER
jgi:predicted PurR-regulated permease PerM